MLESAVVAAPEKVRPPHVAPPERTKAIYMTSWVAGTPSFRAKLEKIIDDTEINAVVIDIKDYTGKIAFKVDDNPELAAVGSAENRIPDIEEFIDELHGKGVYVIGRVAVFQDPYFVKIHPEYAVKRGDQETIWTDRKGISWLDAGAKPVWDYAVAIGKESYKKGFDEINFDYIRFPSDGNMKDIYFPFSEDKVKKEVMKEFFAYVHQNFKDTGIKTSADVFGMVATNTDDLNIGQYLEYILPYFDYVDPMVYPSHFPPGWNNFKEPAANPYDVIKISMGEAVERAKAMGENPLKLRPWLQEFDLGAIYTKDLVQAQIKATYDVGLTSWLMWDPANKYDENPFLPELI